MSPQRIQLRRVKDWRLPENTVVVARSSRWGNPWRVGTPREPFPPLTAQQAVQLYERWLTSTDSQPPSGVARALICNELHRLTGKNLACWCPLSSPCHADVLLRLADTPVLWARAVADAIGGYRYHHADEDGLQAGVAAAITAAGLPAEREVRLSPEDRLDVLTGGVAVEVKTAGTTDNVLRQLQRYAQHDRITALLLVTTKARHRTLPDQVGGKPLRVVHLGGAA